MTNVQIVAELGLAITVALTVIGLFTVMSWFHGGPLQ